MPLSFPRKVILYVIEVGIKVLWIIDLITNFSIRIFALWTRNILAFIVSFAFLIFLGYALSTGYLNEVAEGLLFSTGYSGNLAKTYPLLVKLIPFPQITSKSVLVMDKNKNRVLYEKNSHETMVPASTVKLMTALVVLDLYDLNEELVVSKECTEVEGTKAWFPEKSRFKVKDLFNAMLVGSSGDAACVLATSRVTEKEFVDLMNRKAREIGMNSTVFSNPIGLDNISGGHYSTASDLYKLAVYSLSKSLIEESVKTKLFVLSSLDGTFITSIYNTNRLLWDIPQTVGVKTGTTESAGEVLIYEYRDEKKDLIIIVMASTDRFGDTKMILDWVFDSYSWE